MGNRELVVVVCVSVFIQEFRVYPCLSRNFVCTSFFYPGILRRKMKKVISFVTFEEFVSLLRETLGMFVVNLY